ncbi:lipoprotein [Nanoarchaeota archaeon]
MTMKKILILFLLVLFLTSCNIIGGKKDNGLIATNFKTGTDGLEVEIVEGVPPDEIYEGNSFGIGLKIHNKGAYDVNNGQIRIAGFNEEYTTLDRWQSELGLLEGKSITAPDGDYYIEEFQGDNKNIPEGASEYIEKFFIYVDYDYETEANTDICINPNFYDIKSSLESCEPTKTVSFSGQGAPVAITKVEQVVSPESGNQVKLQFKLTIKNKGSGKVLGPIIVDEVKIANRRLQCSPREIDLEKDDTVVCSGTQSLQGAYITPFSAKLYYTYQTKTSNKLTIKSLKVS